MARRLGGARHVLRPMRVVEEKVDLFAAGQRLQVHARPGPGERALHTAEVELAPHRLTYALVGPGVQANVEDPRSRTLDGRR